jgi:putative ABC transport system substrate-binding protein
VKRREFIALLGGATAAWPLAARAQQPTIPIIGILVPANPEPFRSEFQAGLRELGYREGQNIAFEFRSADGNSARLREMADDLVRLKVDIIIAALTPAATAARQATTEIPIVMVSVGDPVATGLISSLARPGGNVTGLTSGGAELTAKTIELVRKVRGIDDLDAAFNAIVKEQAQAVIVQLSLPRKPIVDHALKSRLPLFGPSPLLAQEGGLISFHPINSRARSLPTFR